MLSSALPSWYNFDQNPYKATTSWAVLLPMTVLLVRVPSDDLRPISPTASLLSLSQCCFQSAMGHHLEGANLYRDRKGRGSSVTW